MIKIETFVKILIVIMLALGLNTAVGCSNDYPGYNSDISKSLTEDPKKSSENIYYEVARVVDGDTIIININSIDERVRLIGVNTPESVKPDTPVEKYGKEASSFTKKLLKNKKVKLEFDVRKRDKYSRLLAYVYLPDGRMVNRTLLEEGYAQVMTVPPNVRYQKEFLKLQKKAREQKKGLWKEN